MVRHGRDQNSYGSEQLYFGEVLYWLSTFKVRNLREINYLSGADIHKDNNA